MKKFNDDVPMKDCPECDGRGYFEDSECCNAEINHGICSDCGEHAEYSHCSNCGGSGQLAKTDDDIQNDKDDASINNYEMVHDGE